MYKSYLFFLFYTLLLCSRLIAGNADRGSISGRESILRDYSNLENNLANRPDSIKKTIKDKIEICQKLNYYDGIAKGYYLLGKQTIITDFNYPVAFNYLLKAQSIFEKTGNQLEIAKCNMQIGLIHYLQRNFIEGENSLKNAAATFMGKRDTVRWRRCAYLYSLCASENGDFQNAEKGIIIAQTFANYGPEESGTRELYYAKGVYFSRKNEIDSAIIYLNKAIEKSSNEDVFALQLFNSELASIYLKTNKKANARKQANIVFNLKSNDQRNQNHALLQAHYIIYTLEKSDRNFSTTLEHLEDYIQLKDSMMNERKAYELARIQSENEINKAEQENRIQIAKQNSIKEAQVVKQRNLKNLFIAGCVFFVILIVVLYFNTTNRKKKNAELASSLAKLKSTQEQLIIQEKLASMGKVSAGIAHEIRNPLNFINNFADISGELIQELNEAKTEEEKEEILNTLQNSLTIIKEHGKRAGEVVKNMLDHSRSSSSLKEQIHFNELCEKALQLALDGLSSTFPKDKFEIIRNYSPQKHRIKVIPEDLTRVLINIFNNAFFALSEKMEKAGEKYRATLTITTTDESSMFNVVIRDNGIGIPEESKEHIFEPFYTTKAPGQGTGLGLSICNEIIKLHGGELSFKSEKGAYTEFRIDLPYKD